MGCLNNGFSSRCKSEIKAIRSRLEAIKRKKNATLRYLRKDIADLLENGHETNAYGRVEGLVHEMNQFSCYELIEQFCGSILEQLSSIRKQRDCPPECREAVSSLMFAAARFADLPELCDLRRIFADRYGNSVESFVNNVFVEKIASKPPSMEQKMQLMRDISQEFILNQNSKSSGGRISSPPSSSSHDEPKMPESVSNAKDHAMFKADEKIPFQQGHLMNTGTRNATRQYVKVGNKTLLKNSDSGHPALAFNTICGRELAENVKPRSTENMVPPYIKPKNNCRGNVEAQHASSSNSAMTSQSIDDKAGVRIESVGIQVESGYSTYERQGVGPGRSNLVHGSEIDHKEGNLVGDSRRKPRYMQQQHLKLPVHKNDAVTESYERGSRNLNNRIRKGTRHRISTYIDNGACHYEEDMVMDELLVHYSKKVSSTYESSWMPTGQKTLSLLAGDDDQSSQFQNKDGPCVNLEADLPFTRALSLPSKSAELKEVSRVPIRATSLQAQKLNPNGRHVHPKLPDYNNLAAQFAALKVGAGGRQT